MEPTDDTPEPTSPAASCPSGKVGYPSARAAWATTSKLARRKNARPHEGVHVYRCDLCGDHHLTSRRKPRPQKGRRTRGTWK